MGLRETVASQALEPSGLLGWLTAWGYRVLSIAWRSQYVKMAVLLELKAEDDFLDIACGSGLFLKKYATGARHVAGLDHSEIQVRMARRINRHRLEAGTAEVIEGDARALPWGDECFSAISCDSLQGISEPMVALREMHRVLRPGGRVVLAFNYFSSEDEAWEAGQRWDLPMWNGAEVEKMIKEAGFPAASLSHDRRVQYAKAVKAGVALR